MFYTVCVVCTIALSLGFLERKSSTLLSKQGIEYVVVCVVVSTSLGRVVYSAQ